MELYHYGVKGMRWGVRRTPAQLGHIKAGKASLRTRHLAKRDAKEAARAKMHYGEGAGNRRKLIDAKVQERSKDPDYKAEFDKYYSKQNMAEHADKVKAERRARDIAKNVSKAYQTGKRIAAMALTAVTVVAMAKQAMNDSRVMGMTYRPVRNITQRFNIQRGRRYINRYGGVNRVDPMLDWRQTL